MRDKEFLKLIGRNIKRHRKEKGLTQVEFASLCGLSREALARIEVGGINSSILKLKNIADALKIETQEFLKF